MADEPLLDALYSHHCTEAEVVIVGLRKAVRDDATAWVDANVIRLLLDRYDAAKREQARTADGTWLMLPSNLGSLPASDGLLVRPTALLHGKRWSLSFVRVLRTAAETALAQRARTNREDPA